MIALGLVFDVGAALVEDESPFCVWMFQHGSAILPLDEIQSQYARQNGNGLIEITALAVAVD
jgi:hypothetical protein